MHTATYSPEDNKLRLYPSSRLPKDLYDRVKAAGFKWAPKQELFVAPAWTPGREDLLIELCGEIGDEDTSLVDRTAERAERFEDYSDKRGAEAEQARAAVSAIADCIPLGQPILVGHHSERHARRDAEKIENGMRRAVRLWETSKYWADRAAGALATAKYKERPDVRYRRIKGLEADLRKQQKEKAAYEKWLALWTKDGLTIEQARHLANYSHLGVCKNEGRAGGYWTAWDVLRPDGERYAECPAFTVEQVQDKARKAYPRSIAYCDRWIGHIENRLAYERAMLGESGGLVTDRHDLQPGGQVLVRGEWLTIIRVNRKGGQAVSVTTNSRYCRVKGVEEIKDYRPPTEDAAAKVKKATTLPPLCNYPGEGFKHITQEQWDKRHKDYKGSRYIEATETTGKHRVRSGMFESGYRSCLVYIADAKRKDPPPPAAKEEPAELPKSLDLPTLERQAAKRAEAIQERQPDAFDTMKDMLRAGVKVVSAPQLFPTPFEIAEQVIDLAELQDGHRVLEPSAGTGSLLNRITCTVEVVAVEISVSLADRLREAQSRSVDVRCADFLSCNGDLGTFDRIVMNPPFANGQDIKHIEHALTFLRPGGRLVAICANGPRQQEKIRPIADQWLDLPANSFEGTGVNAAIVVINRRQIAEPMNFDDFGPQHAEEPSTA